jgi:hypothetical protein
MNSPKTIRIPVSLLAALVFALWWLKSNSSNQAEAPPREGQVRHSSRGDSPAANPLVSALDRLPEKPDRASSLQTLGDLQAKLKSMPRDQAVEWIRVLLVSGKDRPTGLSFEIAAGGSLSEWPTFRTFLLDALLAIDPTAAAEISREILAKPTTADEWALALRNVAKVESSPEATAYLRATTEELISNPAWQAEPSIGYFNAFDVLVHTNATDSTPLLSSLIQRKDRKDLAHAGFLTLDRLVQRNPADELTRLAADRALLESRPEMVAQQFARTDLRDDAQQQLVRSWLLDPARTPTELNAFAGVYPNANFAISNNLHTANKILTREEIASRAAAALGIVTDWLNDPAFELVKPHLTTMQNRLITFVSQTK